MRNGRALLDWKTLAGKPVVKRMIQLLAAGKVVKGLRRRRGKTMLEKGIDNASDHGMNERAR